jgi:hypothetical protein
MSLKQHVGFNIPERAGIGHAVLGHFGSLGYRLVLESPDSWVFERGSKCATFWRFDIRAYATKVVVRVAREAEASLWVSCDFDVWLFAAITTAGDAAVLEAEGRELESKLYALPTP